MSLFLPKTALEPPENGQMKGSTGYSTHAARLTRAEGPSRALYLQNMSTNQPQKGPKSPKNDHLCTLATEGPKPKTEYILGYVAQIGISSAPNPPASTHFCWFPTLEIALTKIEYWDPAGGGRDIV